VQNKASADEQKNVPEQSEPEKEDVAKIELLMRMTFEFAGMETEFVCPQGAVKVTELAPTEKEQ